MYVYQADFWCDECGEKIKQELYCTVYAKHEREKNPGVLPGFEIKECDCEVCLAIRTGDETLYDSDHYPKGPYDEYEERVDAPVHCAGCETFLENPLTEEGYRYVRNVVIEYRTQGRGRKEIVELWANFYNVPLNYEETEEE